MVTQEAEIYFCGDLTMSPLITKLIPETDMERITAGTYRTLRAWRRAQKLSQSEAARILGLSQSHYSKLERRTHALPGKRAKGITKRTGVPLEVLVVAAA